MGSTVRRSLSVVSFVLTLAVQTLPLVFAQENFYKGKTIRLIVGLAPGGGFDAYSRVIARHIGKHIPGNPTTVVDNMPGAASLLAANYVYKAAKPDGLTMVFEHNPLNPLTRRVVRNCAFDEGVELIGRGELTRLFRAAGLAVADREYLLFFPWRADALERRLTRLPLGAQYVVTGTPAA